MIKNDKLKTYTFEFILLLLLFFALFVLNNGTRIIMAVFLTLYAIIIKCFLKKKITVGINQKQVTILMVALAIIYIFLYYLLGIYFGYYKSAIRFNINTIFKYIIPFIFIVVSSEVIRYTFISQRTKYSQIMCCVTMVLIDIILNIGVYDIKYLNDFLAIMGFILFASISCNLLYNYISKKFGYIPIIAYRLITLLYAYIIPFTPDIHIIFTSFIRMIYPYIIYLILEYSYGKTKKVVSYKQKRRKVINASILLIFMMLIIMLISCQFKYGILVIGSKSMTGAINKGDAVVFEKYENQTIEINDVIIFEKDDKKVVHRVVDIKNVNNQIRYFTKGDANQEIDDKFVTSNQIIGISKFKIRYIGKPTIWLREKFL